MCLGQTLACHTSSWSVVVCLGVEGFMQTIISQMFTSHGENANHKVDASVSEEQEFPPVSIAHLLSLFGLPGGKQSNSQYQDVEENHHNNTRDIHVEYWKTDGLNGQPQICVCGCTKKNSQ